MIRLSSALALGLSMSFVAMIYAQELEFPMPQKEHEWLQQFVGNWEIESEGSAGPDQPPVKSTGTMACRMLGGFWVVNEMQADMMGTPMNGVQTIGYDPATKKYIGTWVDSMMNYMWQYAGSVDETGKILTLEAEGPNFAGAGKLAKYRDIYEFKSADHVIVTSSMLGEDGKWTAFMKGTMKRKPAANTAKSSHE